MASARTRSIVIPGGFALLLLLSAFMMVFLSACKHDSPVEPSGPSPDGTWHMITADGADVSATESWWTLNKGESSVWVGEEDCHSRFTYTTSGNKMFSTVVADGCGDEAPGTRDTLTFTIVGDQMTIVSDGSTYVFKKSASGIQPTILGSWTITTIDGEGPPAGLTATLKISSSHMIMTRSSGGTQCDIDFAYTKSGNKLDMITTSSDCGEPEPGTTDTAMWTISGDMLTIVYDSDGTTLVAKRM